MTPLFLYLPEAADGASQTVNFAHVQLIKLVPAGGTACGKVAMDLGTRTIHWTPKSAADLDWLWGAVQRWKPGYLPPRAGMPICAELKSAPARDRGARRSSLP